MTSRSSVAEAASPPASAGGGAARPAAFHDDPFFEAEIASPAGALYYAAEITARNVRNLKAHVTALHAPGTSTRLVLTLAGASTPLTRSTIAGLLRDLTSDGVLVCLCSAAGMVAPSASPRRSGEGRADARVRPHVGRVRRRLPAAPGTVRG